jgi:hypothetical protein
MNKDQRMKHLGYITTAYERFRATIGRSDRSYTDDNVEQTLSILRDAVEYGQKELFPKTADDADPDYHGTGPSSKELAEAMAERLSPACDQDILMLNKIRRGH